MRTIVVMVAVGAIALAEPQLSPIFWPNLLTGPPPSIDLSGLIEANQNGSGGLQAGLLGNGGPGGGSGGLLGGLLGTGRPGGGSGGLLGGLLGTGGPGGGSGGLLGGLFQGLGVGGGGGGLVGGLVNSLGLGDVLGPVDVRLPLKSLTDKMDEIIDSMHLNTLTILFTGDKIDYTTYFDNAKKLKGAWIARLAEE